jgi:hypothetical protein
MAIGADAGERPQLLARPALAVFRRAGSGCHLPGGAAVPLRRRRRNWRSCFRGSGRIAQPTAAATARQRRPSRSGRADIATGAVRGSRRSRTAPTSPARLARREAGRRDALDGQRFRIVLPTLATAAHAAHRRDPVHDASWVDDHRTSFAGGGADAGARCDYDPDSQRIGAVSHTVLAFRPCAAGGRTLRFLNREAGTDADEIPPPPARTPTQCRFARRSRRCPAPRSPSSIPRAPAGRATAGQHVATRRRLRPSPRPAEPAPAVTTNLIPPVPDEPASATDHLFIPWPYGPTLSVGCIKPPGAAGDRLEMIIAGRSLLFQLVRARGSFCLPNRRSRC